MIVIAIFKQWDGLESCPEKREIRLLSHCRAIFNIFLILFLMKKKKNAKSPPETSKYERRVQTATGFPCVFVCKSGRRVIAIVTC